MIFSKTIISAFICMAGLSAMAVTPQARMDISSNGKVSMAPEKKPDGGSLSNPGWVKKGKEMSLTSQSKNLTTNEWIDYEISFVPGNDGTIFINLMGPWYMEKGKKDITPVWICWDDVVVEGGKLVNGDFEKLDDKGKPVGWNVNPKNVVKEDGKAYVKTWHNARCYQAVKVKKGEKVTVKAKVKKAE